MHLMLSVSHSMNSRSLGEPGHPKRLNLFIMDNTHMILEQILCFENSFLAYSAQLSRGLTPSPKSPKPPHHSAKVIIMTQEMRGWKRVFYFIQEWVKKSCQHKLLLLEVQQHFAYWIGNFFCRRIIAPKDIKKKFKIYMRRLLNSGFFLVKQLSNCWWIVWCRFFTRILHDLRNQPTPYRARVYTVRD